jgi:general secretion pathway protein H
MAERPQLARMDRGAHSDGFTLLELLVVMFIIGIIAAMATLSLGTATSQKGAEKELDRIEDLLKLASDESVLQGREFGLTFYETEYVFSSFDPGADRWVPIGSSESEVFGPRRFPPETVVELEIEDRLVRIEREPPAVPEEKKKRAEPQAEAPKIGERERTLPQVFILSSGDITSFDLHLKPAIGEPGVSLSVAENGEVKRIRDEI